MSLTADDRAIARLAFPALGALAAEPLYVLEKDPARRRVTVGPRAALEKRSVALRGVRLHRPAARVDRVKLRYRSKPLRARLHEDTHGQARLELTETALGVAPGQLACLMDGDQIVGWGTIARA